MEWDFKKNIIFKIKFKLDTGKKMLMIDLVNDNNV